MYEYECDILQCLSMHFASTLAVLQDLTALHSRSAASIPANDVLTVMEVADLFSKLTRPLRILQRLMSTLPRQADIKREMPEMGNSLTPLAIAAPDCLCLAAQLHTSSFYIFPSMRIAVWLLLEGLGPPLAVLEAQCSK